MFRVWLEKSIFIPTILAKFALAAMLEKTIKIPFNYKFFMDSQKARWAYSFRKVIRPYSIYTICAGIILAVDMLSEKVGTNHLSSIMGGGLFFYMLLAWGGLYERRVKFFKKARICAQRFDQKMMECTFTFSDDWLEYEDREKSYKLTWQLFKPVVNFKNNIMLITKDSGVVMFTLSRHELGDLTYIEVDNILKEKLG